MFNFLNWSHNKETITIENFIFGRVRSTGKRFFLASFALDEEPQVAIIYCTKEHLKQLADLAGRHYAGIRFHDHIWATHLEKQNRQMFISNAILYLRRINLPSKYSDVATAAFVLDFIIDSSSEENDRLWLATEKCYTPSGLVEKYNEYLRFLKLTDDEGIARHCAGLEDLNLYHSAYVAYLAQEDDAETEEILEDVEE